MNFLLFSSFHCRQGVASPVPSSPSPALSLAVSLRPGWLRFRHRLPLTRRPDILPADDVQVRLIEYACLIIYGLFRLPSCTNRLHADAPNIYYGKGALRTAVPRKAHEFLVSAVRQRNKRNAKIFQCEFTGEVITAAVLRQRVERAKEREEQPPM